MDEYDVCLSVYRHANEVPCGIENLAVLESDLIPLGFHVLLGRDSLSRCILHYNGATRNCTLAFWGRPREFPLQATSAADTRRL